MPIKKSEPVLLLGIRKYIVRPEGNFSCKFGSVDLKKLAGKKFGTKIKIGKEKFTAVKPNINDFLFIKAKRGPQVILPKDLGLIAGITGLGTGWKVLEAGTGSAFLSIQFANLGCKVFTYEKRKDFFELAKSNIKNSGTKGIIIKNWDVLKAKENELDLIALDMSEPEKTIKKLYKKLKAGGWLAVYSLNIEQMQAVWKEINKLGFTDKKIVESLQREWQSVQGEEKTFTRPKTHMIAHTGFLLFARKL